MPSYYSIIQFVPDLVRDERINIGVVAISGNVVLTHFIDNWHRVRVLAGQDGVAFAQGESKRIAAMSAQVTMDAMESWRESIRFTPPAASLLEVHEILLDAARRYLIDPEQKRKDYRDRQGAIAFSKKSVSLALKKRLGKAATKLIQPQLVVSGSIEEHPFDYGIANGVPYCAVFGLSFEVPDTKDLKKAVDAAAWSIDDVRQASPDLPIAVTALSPKHTSETFDRAQNTFSRLGADFVIEDDVSAWASRIAESVAMQFPKLF